ncbi:MAG: HD-GYP domain-containing protein [Phycisphaerales bacterium]
MLRVSTISAKPGMKLATPVFHPESPSRVLLRTGFELDSRTIVRLRELRVRSLWVSYPPLNFLLKHTSPEVIRHRAHASGQVYDYFDRLSRKVDADLDYSAFARTITSLSESLIGNPDTMVFLDDIASMGDEELEHSCSVGFISVLMGLKMSVYLEHQRSRVPAAIARDVTPLGVAGLLHDIGVTQLSDEVRERFRRTRDTSDVEWQRHTELGFQIVHGRVPPSAAAAILHHHQAFDGSGFPARQRADGGYESISGTHIHIHARTVAVADMFDRLSRVSDTDGNLIPRVRVLGSMLQGKFAKKVDPMVMKGLLAVCPPYPPGTQVRLSDGTDCVVVGWEPTDPCRPTVMVLDPSLPESATPGEVIDLSKSSGLCIKVADGQDVGRDNFYPVHQTDYCLETASKLLHNAAELERQRSTKERSNRRIA